MTNTAKEIMVTNLVTLDPGTPVLDGIRKLFRANVKGAPVADADRTYRGVFTERCCLSVLSKLCASRGWSGAMDLQPIRAADIMVRRLWMLRPDMDAFDAVAFLLAHRISGAPVVDSERRFLGTFSEACSIKVLIGAIYDSLPGAEVRSYMDPDPERVVSEDMGIEAVAEMFLDTTYRRLAVIRDGRVVGQISRRDVLAAALTLIHSSSDRDQADQPPWTVAAFMDEGARTIEESTELFAIASIFRETTQRRLPVVQDGRLTGQITRKDLLKAANSILNRAASRTAQPLYLPAVPDASPPAA